MDGLRAWATPIMGAAAVAACVWAAATWQRYSAARRRDKAAQDRWERLHSSPTRVPLPGNALVRDFRGRQAGTSAAGSGTVVSRAAGGAAPSARAMRVVVWNIERGKKIARVIAELRAAHVGLARGVLPCVWCCEWSLQCPRLLQCPRMLQRRVPVVCVCASARVARVRHTCCGAVRHAVS